MDMTLTCWMVARSTSLHMPLVEAVAGARCHCWGAFAPVIGSLRWYSGHGRPRVAADSSWRFTGTRWVELSQPASRCRVSSTASRRDVCRSVTGARSDHDRFQQGGSCARLTDSTALRAHSPRIASAPNRASTPSIRFDRPAISFSRCSISSCIFRHHVEHPLHDLLSYLSVRRTVPRPLRHAVDEGGGACALIPFDVARNAENIDVNECCVDVTASYISVEIEPRDALGCSKLGSVDDWKFRSLSCSDDCAAVTSSGADDVGM